MNLRNLAWAWGVLWLTCLASAGAWAQELPAETTEGEEGVEDIDLEDLLNADVSTASKVAAKTSEAPGIVSGISRDEIQTYGWYSLNDILYRQPGFSPARDYDRRTVAARGQFEGWNNNHLLLLIDGVPYNDNLYGTAYTWEITPLFFAKSVEIVRGPGSALYGGSAMNGVININTASLDYFDTEARGRLRLGTHNTQIYDVLAGHSNAEFATVLSYSRHSTSGEQYLSTDGSGRLDSSGQLARFMVEDSRANDYFFAKIESRKFLKGLSLQFHNQSWNFETGHGWLWYIPDMRESMNESRQMVALSYRPVTGSLQHEYILRYQRHNIDWNMRYYPNDTAGYPAGLAEYLNTRSHDIFARAQLTYTFEQKATVLGGVEYTGFLYTGDDEHYSNVDLTTTYEPFPFGQSRQLGSWLEWIEDKPVSNIGAYVQAMSGELLTDYVTLTLGARYDAQFFQYTDITDPDRSKHNKSYQQFSPRAAVVFTPLSTLSFKALAGRAFRAPSPTELFGANTFSLASNLSQLKPETITTFELASDWRILPELTWRTNVFYREFDNQIAYSVANANLSTNVYSNQTLGVETEALVRTNPADWGQLGGFANYSFVHLLDEDIVDNTIQKSDKLTWVPDHVANVGIDYRWDNLEASVQAHFQGRVRRRSSDRQNTDYLTYRDDNVPVWVTLDVRAGYRVAEWATAGILATNLFDARAPLVKNNDYPFDYRSDGLRVMATLDLKLETNTQ